MYEKFNDQARVAMQLANQQAQIFNHAYIGTEHILLALVENNSSAAGALRLLGVDLSKISSDIHYLVQDGPPMVSMGKLPQTPRTKRALEFAIEESSNLGDNFVGTQHLLLGLIREQEGIAGRVLKDNGVKIDDVRLLCKGAENDRQQRTLDDRDLEPAQVISVLKPGTKVKLWIDGGEWRAGTIQSLRVTLGNVVDYNVIYWSSDDRKTAWVESFEVEPLHADDQPVNIGFIQ